MGNITNACGNRPKEPIKSSFDQFEIEKLRKIYNEVKDQPEEDSLISSDRKLQGLFPENPKFARKLYRWMEANNDDKSQIEFSIFASCFEMFLKDNLDFYMVQYHFRKFEKVEIMALISMEKKHIDKDEFEKLTISYSQALVFFSEITNMFFDSLVNNSQVDDIAAKVVVNYIFGNNCAIDFNLFIERLKHQFENINRVIKDYFASKILDKSLKLKVPTLDNPSYVLNQQLISLLSMSNPNFSNYDKMKLLYSNTDNALSFEKLALALINSSGMETVILIKTVQSYDDSKYVQDNVNVFGAYCSTSWQRMPEPTGDANSYVFSLIPKFRNYFTRFGEGGTNYCYLSVSKEFKKGIGFGGDGKETFRIWLDEDIQNKSYVVCEDRTYENGYLIDPLINVLKISLIEVWGLRNDGCYATVENLRHSEMKGAESMRKMDKTLLRDNQNGTSYKKNPDLMNSLMKSKQNEIVENAIENDEEEVVFREGSQIKQSGFRSTSQEQKSSAKFARKENTSSPLVRSNIERPATYQHRNEPNLFQSAKFEDRKTYDPTKPSDLNYHTLESLNQAHMNSLKDSGFNNPYNHKIEGTDFDNLNLKYSRKELPNNVQDVINKMGTKKGY